MSNFVRSYTPEQEKQVIKLFTRGLRKGEKVVDNTNPTIARETGIKEGTVNSILDNYLEEKIYNLNKRVNAI